MAFYSLRWIYTTPLSHNLCYCWLPSCRSACCDLQRLAPSAAIAFRFIAASPALPGRYTRPAGLQPFPRLSDDWADLRSLGTDTHSPMFDTALRASPMRCTLCPRLHNRHRPPLRHPPRVSTPRIGGPIDVRCQGSVAHILSDLVPLLQSPGLVTVTRPRDPDCIPAICP